MGPINYRSKQSPIFNTQEAGCDNSTRQAARKDNPVRQECASIWVMLEIVVSSGVGQRDALIADMPEHIDQIGQRVDLVHLATFDETVTDGAGAAGAFVADEERSPALMHGHA